MTAPVHIAASGAAQPVQFTTPPRFKSDLAEVAWWLSQPRKEKPDAPDT